jgi:hypothetical protein
VSVVYVDDGLVHCHVLKSFQVIGRTVGLTLVDVDGLPDTLIDALTLTVGRTEGESDSFDEREGDMVAAVGDATSDCEASFEGNEE